MTHPNESIGAEVYEQSIAELQAAMAAGTVTALRLTAACLERIAALDHSGPTLRSVIEINPDALAIAAERDAERAAGTLRGPLHGIPILLKDNIDTTDKTNTTAGSYALLGSLPASEAPAVEKLRAAGAVLLGKANLSEWANFRSNRSSSGWSARGGQVKNPYVLDRNPCGSSAGSAASVAASLCAVAIGSETDGSIIAPSSLCGVVGLKPTVGLISRAGVVPISHTQDTLGPHARSVADAAAVLGVLAGPDERDPATAESAAHMHADYTQFLANDGLFGARIGVIRDASMVGYNEHADAIFATALETLRAQGAELIDPITLTTEGSYLDGDEFTVLLYEFKHDMAAYLATRVAKEGHGEPPRTLADLIAFNERERETELAFFGQELFLLSEAKGSLEDAEYQEALARSRDGTRARINAIMDEHKLDALIAPSMQPAWTTDLLNGDRYGGGSTSPAARAGYPLITVPAGYAFGLPVGLTFMGRAYSEPTLIRLAYAFEQASPVRRPPTYLPKLDLA
jgi:amidase